MGLGSQDTRVHTGELWSPGPYQLLPTQHRSCKDSVLVFRKLDACQLQGLRPLETITWSAEAWPRKRHGRGAGAWFILSPMVWQTVSGEKLPLPQGFSLRPRMSAKPTAQTGKLRSVFAGRSQDPLCLPTIEGQSVLLLTHPQATIPRQTLSVFP